MLAGCACGPLKFTVNVPRHVPVAPARPGRFGTRKTVFKIVFVNKFFKV